MCHEIRLWCCLYLRSEAALDVSMFPPFISQLSVNLLWLSRSVSPGSSRLPRCLCTCSSVERPRTQTCIELGGGGAVCVHWTRQNNWNTLGLYKNLDWKVINMQPFFNKHSFYLYKKNSCKASCCCHHITCQYWFQFLSHILCFFRSVHTRMERLPWQPWLEANLCSWLPVISPLLQ